MRRRETSAGIVLERTNQSKSVADRFDSSRPWRSDAATIDRRSRFWRRLIRNKFGTTPIATGIGLHAMARENVQGPAKIPAARRTC